MPSVVLSCDGERAKLSMKIKTEGNRKYMDLMNACRTVEMLRMSDVSQVAKTQSTTTSFVSVRGVKIPVSVPVSVFPDKKKRNDRMMFAQSG